jgi:hypothetical protein
MFTFWGVLAPWRSCLYRGSLHLGQCTNFSALPLNKTQLLLQEWMHSHDNPTTVKIFFASLWDWRRVFPGSNILSFNRLHTKKPCHATKELKGIFNNNDATLVHKFPLVTHLSRTLRLVSLQPYLAYKLNSKSNVDRVLTSLLSYNFVCANLWIRLSSSSPCGIWRKSSITLHSLLLPYVYDHLCHQC